MRVRVASAGTGKTTALVRRYLELLEAHPPHRVAAVTFTRAAAAQLKSRIYAGFSVLEREGAYYGYVPPPERLPRLFSLKEAVLAAPIHTIHGFFAELLRLVAPAMGLDPDFQVLSAGDATGVFREEVRALLYLRGEDPGLEAPLMHLYEKRALARELRPAGPGAERLWALFRAAERRYLARLGGRALGPADVELRAVQMLTEPPNGALERIRGRYAHVLVDEYQDTNPLQGQAFEALEAAGVSIEVVGDPKQSIYAFRNADVAVFRRALRRGVVEAPLAVSYRHAPGLVSFLNRLTQAFAERGWGFGPEEAPEVRSARSEGGRIELHWVTGEAALAELRQGEARVLAARLRALHDAGRPWREMAVLIQSRGSLPALEAAFEAWGVPFVTAQARGFYGLLEVRDLYHALRVGFDARAHLSLAAFLRGPFGGLSPRAVDAILAAEDPLAALEAYPEVAARVAEIRTWVRQTAPFEALKRLVRTRFLGGKSYLEWLSPAARANVDALLLEFSRNPPARIEALLARLEELRWADEAGEVPAGGEDAVRVVTVHAAKGLEWPVVAVFDLSRKRAHPGAPVFVRPEDGRFATREDPDFTEYQKAWEAREAEEAYRLFYVAASRAAEHLILTGSVALKPDQEGRLAARFYGESWARTLWALEVDAWPEVRARRWELKEVPAAPRVQRKEVQPPAGVPALMRPVRPGRYPPVYSPSALKAERAEALEVDCVDPEASAGGDARAVGILTHYAIAQNWGPDDPEHFENLRAQEVMLAYAPEEQERLLAEVRELLRAYRALLGRELPWPRDEDYPELPLALPHAGTVWEGVIDRLYRVGDRWYLEDYKTDRTPRPERYAFQLALYRRGVREAWGIEPEVRLVFLRTREVVCLEPRLLEEAFQRGVGEAEPI
ncbi:UvrD-helicase domain-containing protein [Marinithermus hydrothermalis]|uniref:DNA 3'-5' helicase n=1 Tax=Marinithermus hydrothermalis (strain DSM 14884 / JCM 11576 / T1) TaxID=869210 RepID=F2NKF8_MARHT|nr:UvrD-helicase domain-containing protein [Marinithermus hydrothermalis]AEB12407.1 UvrD/REP helicase [Marinithermus hydrothermalis DSM 14884]